MQKKISLSDKYEKREGKIFLTGIQALVRLPLIQKDLDAQNAMKHVDAPQSIRGELSSPALQ